MKSQIAIFFYKSHFWKPTSYLHNKSGFFSGFWENPLLKIPLKIRSGILSGFSKVGFIEKYGLTYRQNSPQMAFIGSVKKLKMTKLNQ